MHTWSVHEARLKAAETSPAPEPTAQAAE
jgi:hypothetical protein